MFEVERLIVPEHLRGEEPAAPDAEEVALPNEPARLRQFQRGNDGT